MRGIPSLAKPLMESRGPIGKILTIAGRGAGAGVIANVADKELLNSRLKNAKVALPVQLTDMLKGTGGTVVVTANATDAVMLLVANGLKIPNGKSIITMAGLFLAKKLAEARGWIIDDDIPNGNANQNNAAELETMRQQLLAAQQRQYQNYDTGSGGLTHN